MKSIFVSMYMMAAMIITGVAVYFLWGTRDFLSWGGVLLVTAPFMAVLTAIMMFQNVARTSARFPVLIALATIGVGLSIWGYAKSGNIDAPVLAISGWVGFMAYSFWYSSFSGRLSRRLKVGQVLPDFELLDVDGQNVSPETYSDKPTVWVFYRGNWCPLCMAQIKELVAQYKEIEELGARVAMVSPQPHGYTLSLAKRHSVSFEFLTDKGNRAARILGIDHPFGIPLGMQALGYDSETVLPTVVITDRGGQILWVHETDNYRIRPEPETYLSVLR